MLSSRLFFVFFILFGFLLFVLLERFWNLFVMFFRMFMEVYCGERIYMSMYLFSFMIKKLVFFIDW